MVKLFSILKAESKDLMNKKFLVTEMFFLDDNQKTFKKNFKYNHSTRNVGDRRDGK